MTHEVVDAESTPPVSSDAITGLASEVARDAAPMRIDDPDRHSLAAEHDRELQVRVIGHHDRRIDALGQDVDQEMRGDVDVRALNVSRSRLATETDSAHDRDASAPRAHSNPAPAPGAPPAELESTGPAISRVWSPAA